MVPEHLDPTALYQDPDGSLVILNSNLKLAWRLEGSLQPGQAFNDLLASARGQTPRFAENVREAPDLIAEWPTEDYIVAGLSNERFNIFWNRLQPRTRTYLGCDFAENPGSPTAGNP